MHLEANYFMTYFLGPIYHCVRSVTNHNLTPAKCDKSILGIFTEPRWSWAGNSHTLSIGDEISTLQHIYSRLCFFTLTQSTTDHVVTY